MPQSPRRHSKHSHKQKKKTSSSKRRHRAVRKYVTDSFVVSLDGKNATVLDMQHEEPVLETTYVRDFHPSSGKGSEHSMISVLLHVREQKEYVWIGNRMVSFSSRAKIVSFASDVEDESSPWTRSVPLPYATDEEGNVYLFNHDVILLRPELGILSHNPYLFYWQMSQLSRGRTANGQNEIVPRKRMIPRPGTFLVDDVVVGNKKETVAHPLLHYVPNPSPYFDSMTDGGAYSVYIRRGEEWTELTKPKFVSFMKKVGEGLGFAPVIV